MLSENIKRQILADIEDSNNFYESTIEPALMMRQSIYDADRDYYKEMFPLLSENSEFVSFDFWGLVQFAVPRIMSSFFNGGDAVMIMGRTEEDVDNAENMRHLIDYQIMTQNRGFLMLWDWFADAFKYNLGALKVYWKREAEWIEEELNDTPIDRLMEMSRDPNIQVVSFSPSLPEYGLFNVKYVVKRIKENRPVIETIPISDLRWTREAKTLQDANFVAHRKVVTGDYLRKQAQAGIYDAGMVEIALQNTKGGSVKFTEFEQMMNPDLTEYKLSSTGSGANDGRNLVELYECYTKIDIDGDGLLEDCIVTVVEKEIIRYQCNPWGQLPIFTVSPIRDPFKVMANVTLSEIVGEIQAIKVALIRQMLLNIANSNDIKFFIDPMRVNTDDLNNNAKFVRVENGSPTNAVQPFPTPNMNPMTMSFMEMMNGFMEEWTGKTRYNQGLESRSLNKTATGISILTQASNQRMDYFERVFAETGFSDFIRLLIKLNNLYIDQDTVIRLNNKYLTIRPDDISGNFDVDVNTDAGTGRREQNIQNMQYFLSQLCPMAIQYGAATPSEWAHGAIKLLEESGIRNPEKYVKDPKVIQQELIQQGIQQVMQSALPGLIQQFAPGITPEMMMQIIPQLLQAAQTPAQQPQPQQQTIPQPQQTGGENTFV